MKPVCNSKQLKAIVWKHKSWNIQRRNAKVVYLMSWWIILYSEQYESVWSNFLERLARKMPPHDTPLSQFCWLGIGLSSFNLNCFLWHPLKAHFTKKSNWRNPTSGSLYKFRPIVLSSLWPSLGRWRRMKEAGLCSKKCRTIQLMIACYIVASFSKVAPVTRFLRA